MSVERPRLLAVDDEAAYRKLLEQTLELEGYAVDFAASGAEALRLATLGDYRLILLDLMLPGMDGFEVCRRLRASSTVPIIMLTALAQESEIIAGLHAGADDYITKPFSVPELLARIAAVLRRTRDAGTEATPVRTGALTVHLAGGLALKGSESVALTATEYRLLAYLARHLGRVLTHQQLLEHGWGPGYTDAPQLLHVTISRLRAKVEPDPAHPRHVVTRVGIGYSLAALPPDAES